MLGKQRSLLGATCSGCPTRIGDTFWLITVLARVKGIAYSFDPMPPRAAKIFAAGIVLSYAGLLAALYVSNLQRGLWEDGYFTARFAHNFWHHRGFAWNASDGPVYGMTSQTLQLLGAALYAVDARHVVILLKAALCGSALASLLAIGRLLQRQDTFPLGLIPAAVGLSAPLLLELLASGLETAIALYALVIAIGATLEFTQGRTGPVLVALTHLLVYWTRPDAIVIPLALLVLLGWDKPRVLTALALVGGGLAISGGVFYLYYGTALPLPFYIKTHGFSVQTQARLANFAPEKTKNALQAAFFTLPFVYVAAHHRTRRPLALLAAGFSLAGYHYFATVETMGHHSRFYLPALVPIWIAAALAYPAYLRKRRITVTYALSLGYVLVFYWLAKVDAARRIDIMLDPARYYPYLAGCAVMLFAPNALPWVPALLLAVVFAVAAIRDYPLGSPRLEDDETILLRQIAPRRVFRGLARLRERVPVRALFHTDMGAPGLLFPDARVVDLDGLLNEAITLHGARFETLCRDDRPEAIFVPNEDYAELRRQVLESECFRNYRPVDDNPSSQLRVREDMRERYLSD